METYYTIIVFIFGTLFGSFFNVVGYRLPKEESIIFPSSHCPNCNHKLGMLELIPIFSFLCLGGKCKKCHTKISWIYPIFELCTGVLFALSYIIFGFDIDFIIALTFISVLLIIIVSDIRYMIIPDEVLFVGITCLFAEIFIKSGWVGCLEALVHGLISFGIMFLFKCMGDFLFKKESMGGGDIKLMFLFGMVLGWPLALISIFLASFIGLPISIYIVARKKTNIIPFGPFLSVAAMILFFTQIDFQGILNLLILK